MQNCTPALEDAWEGWDEASALPLDKQTTGCISAATGRKVDWGIPLVLSLPRLTRWRRKPVTEASATAFRDEDDVVRQAVFEHQARLLREGQAARDVLAALVKAILGREPDAITHVPWLEDPVALVSGIVFRGEADDPCSLKGGWLCVAYEGRTGTLGWHQVNSVDHLGELAMRYRFKRWPPS